jgi:C4-dicarboxylate-specific signal transduction histidine kinase
VRGLFVGLISGATAALPLTRQNFRVSAESIFPVVAVALTGAIFIADTVTELEIAFPAFYTAVVLMAVRFCEKRGVILVGIGCVGLTLLSDFLTRDAAPTEAGVINTAISLVAIASTTYLALKIASEKEAAYQARSQLAHVARVTTLGEMAASIAHEVNQPLAAVTINGNACLHWLDTHPPNLDEAKKAVTRLVKDADRASDIIVQVRKLTKGSSPEPAWLEINDIILATIGLVSREIQQNQASLRTQLSENISLVQGDPVQLQQVVLNLILNGIESMHTVAAGSRELTISTAKCDEGVLISVQDTGAGFAPEDADRIFNAFYTTKHGGMGMGLAISRSIVESHGGRIWAAQNAPSGADIQFILPAAAEPKS